MRKLALVIIVFTLFQSNYGQGSPPAFDNRFQDVRGKAVGLITDGKVASMSIAVAKDGKIIWEETFGWSDLENKVRAVPYTKDRSGINII